MSHLAIVFPSFTLEPFLMALTESRTILVVSPKRQVEASYYNNCYPVTSSLTNSRNSQTLGRLANQLLTLDGLI
ncbi:hypothetical protein [Synechocystis sp. PCC 7509]|uniref:hypothetical protein n=1 Tax=Synechocystis sp. PCC 7509 TaxID=927677 RepID=UPI0002ACE2D6|nr:hypothetical protein [Synechocystis sp. PCC 7509]